MIFHLLQQVLEEIQQHEAKLNEAEARAEQLKETTGADEATPAQLKEELEELRQQAERHKAELEEAACKQQENQR